jgi:hypothetical protein
MHVPTEEELAAIAVAYLAVQRASAAPAEPASRWRAAARAQSMNDPRRGGWRNASRLR